MESEVIEGLNTFESRCETATGSYIEEHASRYEEPWEDFRRLFRHLYLFACCFWGCHGREHVFEHLAGKTVTNASVATRAMFHGYYDESLALIRNIGEIANLANLFWSDGDKIREWIDSDGKTRMKTFSPASIRKMLESNGVIVPFDEEHYRFLCETAVHPVPHVSPNSYNVGARPVLGLVFQREGFDVVFWNLLWATSAVCGPIAKLAILDRRRAEEFVELTIPVFEAACKSEALVPETKVQGDK